MELSNFKRLPISLPPMLPEVIGLKSEARFFSLSYECSKGWWSDGRAGAPFPYFAVYEPYINHVTMAIHLLDADLGSDDGPPTHALLIDRQDLVVYVGDYDEVQRLLQQQHPPHHKPTLAEPEGFNRHLAEMERINLDQLRDQGVFEFLLGSKPEQQDRCAEMVAWLDQFIDDELIRSYLAAADAGNIEALYHLHRFRQKVEAARKVNTQSRWTH